VAAPTRYQIQVLVGNGSAVAASRFIAHRSSLMLIVTPLPIQPMTR